MEYLYFMICSNMLRMILVIEINMKGEKGLKVVLVLGLV